MISDGTLIRTLTLLGITLCGVIVSNAQKEETSRRIDSMVADRMKREKTPGFAIGVARAGKVIFAKGYGLANIEQKTPMTLETSFQIMSISKTFTALCVMALVEDGKINLDDPVSKFIPGLPPTWEKVTVRHGLSHTSGVKSFAGEIKERCDVGKDVLEYDLGDAAKEVTCLPLDFQPGERWAYGDTLFYLFPLMVQNVSGKEYSTFLRERIFNPLGMTRTKAVDYREITSNRAGGYTLPNGEIRNASPFYFPEIGNGGLASNLGDMLKLEQAFTTEKVLKRSTIEQMLSNARLNNGEIVSSYGLGVGLTPFQGRKRFGHNGGSLGFATSFTHFPAEAITVVVLSNAESSGIGTFANEIAALFFQR